MEIPLRIDAEIIDAEGLRKEAQVVARPFTVTLMMSPHGELCFVLKSECLHHPCEKCGLTLSKFAMWLEGVRDGARFTRGGVA